MSYCSAPPNGGTGLHNVTCSQHPRQRGWPRNNTDARSGGDALEKVDRVAGPSSVAPEARTGNARQHHPRQELMLH